MGADLERTAIMRLQEAANMSERFYKAPLIVTTSGGKDSSVCIALAERAGIEFEVMHNHTTVDAPETVYFIRNELKRLEQKGVKCFLNYPYYKGERVTMWSLIPQKLMPPTRLVRYCCSILKEQGGQGRYITTGVRWAESAKRKQRGIYEDIASKKSEKVIINNDNDDRRRLFESCMRQRKAVCNPIIDWKDSDVWDYIESEKNTGKPALQVWLLPRWVRRLPYGWKSRQERRVCPLSEISGSVYTSVRANAGRTEAARKDNKAKLGNRAGRVSLVDRGRRFTGAD